MTFSECRWRLRQSGAKCSAMSFTKDNKCCLHDRTAADYGVVAEQGARHTVSECVHTCVYEVGLRCR